MEKYRIAPIEQIMCDFLLNEGGKGSPAPTITTVLHEKVDVAALRYAVDAAMAFHPYFVTRLMREGCNFYWQKNSRTPVISEKRIVEDFPFGDQSNHFFPWVVTYFDHSIYFDYSHELTDAGGAAVFCATLMEYYTRYINGDMSPIAEKDTREERLAREAALPTEIAYRKDVRAIYQPKNEAVSSFCPEMVGEKTHFKKFCIDSKTLRKISFRYDASPSTLIAPILARASMPYLSGENKIAKLLIPQNVRSYYDSQTLYVFSLPHPFYYFDDKMRNMPIEQVSTLFRGRLDLLSDISVSEAFFTTDHDMGQCLHLPEMRAQAQKGFEEMVYQQVTIAYTHLTRSGMSEKISENASKHISDVYLDGVVTGSTICCYGFNFGDHVNLTIGTKFLEDGFFKSVCAQLDELGVGYSMQAIDAKGDRSFVFSDDADS